MLSSRKPVDWQPAHSFPSVAVLMLHSGCGMRCTFCINEDDLECLSLDQAIDALEGIRERGIRNVVLGGGEPYDWPGGLLRLASLAKDMGFFVQVGTNGVSLPEDFAQEPWVDRYILPIEALHAFTHDRLRSYRGRHHSIVMDRLMTCREFRKPVTLSTVVTRVNKHSLTDLGHFLREYNRGSNHVHAWHLYRFLPQGRGGRLHSELLDLTLSEYNRTVGRIKSMDLGFRVYLRPDMYRSSEVDFLWQSKGVLHSAWKDRETVNRSH